MTPGDLECVTEVPKSELPSNPFSDEPSSLPKVDEKALTGGAPGPIVNATEICFALQSEQLGSNASTPNLGPCSAGPAHHVGQMGQQALAHTSSETPIASRSAVFVGMSPR